jgi:hypothetical protein
MNNVLAIYLYKYFLIFYLYGVYEMFVIAPPGVVAYPNRNVAPLDNVSCLDKLQANPVDPFAIVA